MNLSYKNNNFEKSLSQNKRNDNNIQFSFCFASQIEIHRLRRYFIETNIILKIFITRLKQSSSI